MTPLTWLAVGLAAWLAVAVPVAVVIGRAVSDRDRREVDAAMDRHPAGKAERHLRVVAS